MTVRSSKVRPPVLRHPAKNPIFDAMDSAVEKKVFPGAVLSASRGQKHFFEAFGWMRLFPRKQKMMKGTIFDIASLTKPVATTTAVMCLLRDGALRLEDRLVRFLRVPDDKKDISIHQLLTHSSGLPEWKPYYKKFRGNDVVDEVLKERLLYRPGSRSIYSDLGFILLGRAVEKASGGPLDAFCQETVFGPLRMKDTSFHPPKRRCAATEKCPWRRRVLQGEVHDENAWAMGGVAGHAGLFSTAGDLMAFSKEILDCYYGRGQLIPQKIAHMFLGRQSVRSTWAVGWDTPTPGKSSSGELFSRRSVGHLGFTGTSIWIDLWKEAVVVFLTNRVHPSRKNEKIKEFRPAIHNIIMNWIR